MIKEFSGEYRWLSNFAHCPVSIDGDYYPTIENAYQASKTLDKSERRFLNFAISNPGQAKSAGRKVNLRSDWEEVKLSIMEDLNRQKYNNPSFKSKLLETGTEEIIEGNTWGDIFWGVCGGVGENNLGKIIMKIRDELNLGE